MDNEAKAHSLKEIDNIIHFFTEFKKEIECDKKEILDCYFDFLDGRNFINVNGHLQEGLVDPSTLSVNVRFFNLKKKSPYNVIIKNEDSISLFEELLNWIRSEDH